MPSSVEVRTTPPQAASGAPELVKGLGLTSATTLVMGSMIGSGIFIVSAEIAREVNSPALLIGAWLVTGFMTIVGALSYGELAAMMPRAGGQYVYLRESLGSLWGFLVWMDFVSGHPDRDGGRRGRGVRQISGALFPLGICDSLAGWAVPCWRCAAVWHCAGRHGYGPEHAEPVPESSLLFFLRG